jgi:N-acyl-L-homoserine lactone synthetase
VATNTLSTLAPVNTDISVANPKTNTSTMAEVTFLLILVKKSKNTGMRTIVTATQTAMIFPTRVILSVEKK